MGPLLDPSIRAALIESLRREDPAAAIFEELPLVRGRSRADVVAVNGVLAGFEIKSERDSLTRLGLQAPSYESVFERVTLVVARRHLRAARRLAPRHWGLIVVEACGNAGVPTLRRVRTARPNAHVDPAVLARLLWKRECLRVLARYGDRSGCGTPIIRLWERLAALPHGVLRREVRESLKARRAATPPARRGGSRTTAATA